VAPTSARGRTLSGARCRLAPAVCAHVQTAGEANHQLSGAGAVPHAPTDRDGRRPVALAAQAVRGGPVEAVAEVGAAHGQAVQPGRQAGLTPARARPLTAATPQRGLFSTAECTSEAATATAGGPAGERRRGRVDTGARGRHRRDEAPSAWRSGPLQAPGPRHTGGRRIPRGVDEPGRAACRLPVLADQRRRVVTRVALPRRWARRGAGGQGAPVGTAESRLRIEPRRSSRPPHRLNPRAGLRPPSALRFYTVWRNIVLIDCGSYSLTHQASGTGKHSSTAPHLPAELEYLGYELNTGVINGRTGHGPSTLFQRNSVTALPPGRQRTLRDASSCRACRRTASKSPCWSA
jgi:hypothetical protein